MPGKNKIRHFSSLNQKKYRQIHGQFLAEGRKVVLEIVREGYPCSAILATNSWLLSYADEMKSFTGEIISCTGDEISKLSNLESPQEVIAICKRPESQPSRPNPAELTLYLDGLRDPGNLGTLIRLSDWFGIRRIFVSEDTVDWTNPKVIQSSMGSFIRVLVHEVIPEVYFKSLPPDFNVMAADLKGESIYQPGPVMTGVLIIGSESHGLTPALNKYISHRLHIPRFGMGEHPAESLNAAVAASLIIGELRRRQLQ